MESDFKLETNKTLIFFILGFILIGIATVFYMFFSQMSESLEEVGWIDLLYIVLCFLAIYIFYFIVSDSYVYLNTKMDEEAIRRKSLLSKTENFFWVDLKLIGGLDHVLFLQFKDNQEVKIPLWYFKNKSKIIEFVEKHAKQSKHIEQ